MIGRHAKEEATPAREAHKNRFNSHFESAEISYWLRGSPKTEDSRLRELTARYFLSYFEKIAHMSVV